MSGARDVEELVSWQRMHDLNVQIHQATQTGCASGDLEFRGELRHSAAAAERHIVDGFERRNALAFANFLDFSRTAACATRSLLRKGLACAYFSAEEFRLLDDSAVHGLKAVAGLQRYLRSPDARRNVMRRYPRPFTAPHKQQAGEGELPELRAHDPDD
jgi:four helix bundle protein